MKKPLAVISSFLSLLFIIWLAVIYVAEPLYWRILENGFSVTAANVWAIGAVLLVVFLTILFGISLFYTIKEFCDGNNEKE